MTPEVGFAAFNVPRPPKEPALEAVITEISQSRQLGPLWTYIRWGHLQPHNKDERNPTQTVRRISENSEELVDPLGPLGSKYQCNKDAWFLNRELLIWFVSRLDPLGYGSSRIFLLTLRASAPWSRTWTFWVRLKALAG